MELSPSRLKRNPVMHYVNQTERTGRITKRGSKLGRTALVQCALIAKRYSPDLANYYEHPQPARNRSRHHRRGPPGIVHVIAGRPSVARAVLIVAAIFALCR